MVISAAGVYIVAYVLLGFTLNYDIAIFAAIVSAGAGRLPDMIEPSKKGGWNHRKVFHGYVVFQLTGLATLITFMVAAITTFIVGINWTFILFALPFGYFLHLVADSMTKMGLPRKGGKAYHLLGG